MYGSWRKLNRYSLLQGRRVIVVRDYICTDQLWTSSSAWAMLCPTDG